MGDVKFDFSSPFVSAAIVLESGDRVPLWLQPEVAQGSAVKLGVFSQLSSQGVYAFPYMTELTVELSVSYIPRITATLQPPYKEALAFLDSDLLMWGQSYLEVVLGYSSGTGGGSAILSPVFSGILLKPSVDLGQEVTITLVAHGGAIGFSGTRQERNRTFNGRFRRNIITEIATGDGREVDIDTSYADSVPEVKQLLDTDINYTQGGITDYVALLELARQAHCYPMEIGKQLILYPYTLSVTGQPQLMLMLYDYPNGQLGPAVTPMPVYPILSASSPMMAVYLPGALQGMKNVGIKSDNREVVETTVSANETGGSRGNEGDKAAPGGSPAYPTPDASKGGGTHFYGDPKNPPDIKAEMSTAMEDYRSLGGVPLNIETLGIPTLMPGAVAAVRGLGQKLSRNYGIFSLTHTINASGFYTSLVTRSDTSPLEFGLDALGINVQDPVADGVEKVTVTPKAQPQILGKIKAA